MSGLLSITEPTGCADCCSLPCVCLENARAEVEALKMERRRLFNALRNVLFHPSALAHQEAREVLDEVEG